MKKNYSVSLNFLPLQASTFSFTVFRRAHAGEEKNDMPRGVSKRKLPTHDGNHYGQYWVGFSAIDGYNAYTCESLTNPHLSCDYLLHLLLASCQDKGIQLLPHDDESAFSRRRASFILERHSEGEEIIWLQPHYLKTARRFGFLIDFHFRKHEDCPFSKRVQQLSLSLDKFGRENRSYYSDRFDKIGSFMYRHFDNIFPLRHDLGAIHVDRTLFDMPAQALDKKKYVFSGNRMHTSQFVGVKDFGPLSGLDDTPAIFFVYQQQHRLLSLDLYKALRGKRFPNTFAGTENMFGFTLSAKNVKGIAVTDFGKEEMQRVRDTVRTSGATSPMVILIAPWDEDSPEYFQAKHVFVTAQIPSQVVRLFTLERDSRLKWSTSNIALQCFAKLGGKPWKVKPRHARCLIIGIGQSHRYVETDQGREERKIEKYFAYSVLTDSGGLFKELRVLGQSGDAGTYLDQLRESVGRIVRDHSDDYTKYVIHAPYKIRGAELEAIEKTLGEIRESAEFVVLRINAKNRFFGYSRRNNSLVPFESTFIRLAWNEYLVWFEGLQYHNPKAARRYARPVHIVFHYTNRDLSDEDRLDYLQDALNLSGANWRGFNAKSVPVSIYYAHLIARFTGRFDELGLPAVELDNLNPWFL